MQKQEALANYLEIPLENISKISDSVFAVGNYDTDYKNYQEWLVYTDEEANEAVKQDIENVLADAGWCFNLNIEDYIDGDEFYSDMYESTYGYATDIKNEEDYKHIFENRFFQECAERGIIRRNEFKINEYGLLEPEGDIYDYMDDFVNSLMGDYANSLDWFISNFGTDELSNLYRDGKIDIDIDALTKDIISSDGRGNSLSSYDGLEIELDGGYFAFRI